jgi:hypothetical protein
MTTLSMRTLLALAASLYACAAEVTHNPSETVGGGTEVNQGTSEPPASGVDTSVCEGCGALGSQASPAVPHPCDSVSGSVPLDGSLAASEGFDVDDFERRLVRGGTAPMRWQRRTGESGEATGFQNETSIALSITVDSRTLVRPDPAFCDGSTCRRNGVEISQSSCKPRLSYAVTINAKTQDGAIAASVPGEAVYSAPGGSMFAAGMGDLRRATGKLRLQPSRAGEPYSGSLTISVDLQPEQSSGTVVPQLLYGAQDVEPRRDSPVEGLFGERYGASPGGGGAGPKKSDIQ